jgi:hypothetical protein
MITVCRNWKKNTACIPGLFRRHGHVHRDLTMAPNGTSLPAAFIDRYNSPGSFLQNKFYPL